MCQIITVNGNECRTYGELKKAVGFTPPTEPANFELLDDDCLCCVNVLDVAVISNYKYESGDGFDAVLTSFKDGK
jgi:hypothetical protein